MIDAIAETSEKVLALFASWAEFLGTNPRIVAAMAIALLVSWGATQVVKRETLWQGRRLTAISFVLGFVVCFTIATLGVLSPFPWVELWIAVAVGLFAPGAYKLTRAILAERFPRIEKLSSAYSLIKRRSEGGGP